MIRFVVFYSGRLEREQRESTFVIILQIARWFASEATAELPGGGGSWNTAGRRPGRNGWAGNLLSRESHQWWGWIGGGETAGIVADSRGSFCAAGGVGFPVTEIRDGNGRWLGRRWLGQRGGQWVGKSLTLRCLRDLCVRWALGHRHSELWGEVWTRDDANRASWL